MTTTNTNETIFFCFFKFKVLLGVCTHEKDQLSNEHGKENKEEN